MSLGPWLPWPKPSAEEWEWEREGKYEVGTDYLAHHKTCVLYGLWHQAVHQDRYSEGTPSSGDKSSVMRILRWEGRGRHPEGFAMNWEGF